MQKCFIVCVRVMLSWLMMEESQILRLLGIIYNSNSVRMFMIRLFIIISQWLITSLILIILVRNLSYFSFLILLGILFSLIISRVCLIRLSLNIIHVISMNWISLFINQKLKLFQLTIRHLLSNLIHFLFIIIRVCEELINKITKDFKNKLTNNQYQAENLDFFYDDFNEIMKIYCK
jgi:hypothetical protein